LKNEFPLNSSFLSKCHDAEYRLRPVQVILLPIISEAEYAALPFPRRHTGLQKRFGKPRGLSTEWSGLARPDELCTAPDVEIPYQCLAGKSQVWHLIQDEFRDGRSTPVDPMTNVEVRDAEAEIRENDVLPAPLNGIVQSLPLPTPSFTSGE
jgi:hypothetical protein